jgi:LPS sulfotransferase NodH
MEYLNPVEQNKPWMRDILGESTLVEGFDQVLLAGTTPNAMFGVKVHWNHFRFLGMSLSGEWNETQRTAMYDLLQSQLPRLLFKSTANELLGPRFADLRAHAAAYRFLLSRVPDLAVVWLKRENMVARAISHFRARRSGVWHQSVAHGVDPAAGRPPEFNLAEIHILYCLGAFQEAMWQRFFEQHAVTPHIVTYERLVADRQAVVGEVLEFLGDAVDGTPISQPFSVKQSDALSAEWEQRYREWSLKAHA